MRRRNGFTLVELLVVISIIALLMGILAGAISKVRTIAKRTTCKAGLHDLALAFRMYLDDSRNTMPIAQSEPWNYDSPSTRQSTTVHDKEHKNSLSVYLPPIVSSLGSYLGVSSTELAVQANGKKCYAKLLSCPADNVNGVSKYFFNIQQSSYSYNQRVAIYLDNGSIRGNKLDKTAFRHNAKDKDVEIMGDFGPFHGKKPESGKEAESIGTFNYLYADCHVGDRKGY